MTIEYRRSGGTEDVVTTACPLCGTAIRDQQSLAQHLRYSCERGDHND